MFDLNPKDIAGLIATAITVEVPAVVFLTYAWLALTRAGWSLGAKWLVALAALVSPGIALAVGLGVERALVATASERDATLPAIMAAVASSSLALAVALAVLARSRALLTGGVIATVAALTPLALATVIPLPRVALLTAAMTVSFLLWHALMYTWLRGWAEAEEQRLNRESPA